MDQALAAQDRLEPAKGDGRVARFWGEPGGGKQRREGQEKAATEGAEGEAHQGLHVALEEQERAHRKKEERRKEKEKEEEREISVFLLRNSVRW